MNEEFSTQCEFCGKKYKTIQKLKNHFRFCHPKVFHNCSICNQKFPKKWLLNVHLNKHTGQCPYKCVQCGEEFVSSSHLRNHKNFVHKDNGLLCKLCGCGGFYKKQDLDNHTRTKHTKERVFLCAVCNKSFMSSSVYYQHRYIHSGIKKYGCTICKKKFSRWLTLQNHLRIHNDEKPFPCDVCRRAFRQKSDMKKHRATQHCNIKN